MCLDVLFRASAKRSNNRRKDPDYIVKLHTYPLSPPASAPSSRSPPHPHGTFAPHTTNNEHKHKHGKRNKWRHGRSAWVIRHRNEHDVAALANWRQGVKDKTPDARQGLKSKGMEGVRPEVWDGEGGRWVLLELPQGGRGRRPTEGGGGGESQGGGGGG
ncbi:hypothetical protein LTS18_007256, partial [Coniosporium uncinatum]